MVVRVMRAEYLGEYRIHLLFIDAAEGDVDLSGELVWANGADIAPEFLYEKLQLPVGVSSNLRHQAFQDNHPCLRDAFPAVLAQPCGGTVTLLDVSEGRGRQVFHGGGRW